MARLNGRPESRIEGVWKISLKSEVALSSTLFVNGSIKTVPTINVLKHVRPNKTMLIQGKLSRTDRTEISAGGLNVLSMKQLQLLLQRLQRLQILAWLEAHGLTRGDIYFGTGAGVSPDAGLTWFYREDAEASQLNPIVGLEGIFHAIEDGVDRLFCFSLADTRPLDDLIHEIEFDHWLLRLTNLYRLSLLQTYSYHPYGELSNVN
jgi:hypothetical protein